MSKIKTFEDACKALGLDSKKVIPDYSTYPEKHRKSMEAHAKLVIIIEALNEGWKPMWDSFGRLKHEPNFKMDDSFSFQYCIETEVSTIIGSRLCFRYGDLAEYAGKQFEELYKDYFLI